MTIDKVVSAARAEVGVREVPEGSNWGPRVSKYIREAGYDDPVFWCMCFCTAILRWTLGAQAKPWPRTGSCDVVLSWARKNGVLHDDPKVGDVFLVMASANDATHTGFVVGLPGGGKVDTVEGNTNDNGSSNGIGVFHRTRKVSNLKFVRWIDAMPDGLADLDQPTSTSWTVKIGAAVIDLQVDGTGRTIGPAKKILQALEGIGKLSSVDANLQFDAESHTLMFAGNPIPTQVTLKDGRSMASVRDLADFAKATVTIAGKVITLT